MPKIIILWASIRPMMLYGTYQEYMKRCKYPENISLKIAVANENQKIELESYFINNREIIIVDDKPGYNHAITVLTKNLETEDDTILLLLSDDFYPPNNVCWDEWLINKFGTWDGALFLDDGYQDKYVKDGSFCITLACMTFKCLKKLNKVVFHPDYTHFFSDTEAFVNLRELNLLKDDRDIDNVMFEHRHYVTGKRKEDEFDKKNNSNWDKDHLTFNSRMCLNVLDRLK
jgi:hypothetical protein